jgi:integrase/uncharacterized protein YbdZ (MbtH family)
MMAAGPGPKISIFEIGVRPRRKKPYTVRWTFNGKACWLPAMASRKEADRARARLILCVEQGVKWNSATGLPVSWNATSEVDVAAWCQAWLRQEWFTLAPNSRRSIALSLVFMVERSAPVKAPELTVELRLELRHWFSPGSPPDVTRTVNWIAKYSPSLSSLDASALLELDRRLRLRVDGVTPLGTLTARRQANTARQSLDAAVRDNKLKENDWPKPVKGVDRRKKVRKASKTVTGLKRVVIAVPSAHAILDRMPNRQAESWRYRCMSAVEFFVGTRPSECATLEVEDFTFSADPDGWGLVSIVRSWNGGGGGWGENTEDVGDVKTFDRVVPVSPFVQAEVKAWMARAGISSGPLFLYESGTPPGLNNWRRALATACRKAEVKRVTPYDCRHFCATSLVDSHMRLGRAAHLMGHDVTTLVRYYLHDSEGGDDETIALMSKAFEYTAE